MKNDVRLGRLTTSEVNPTKATLVVGLDATYGPVLAALRRIEPSAEQGHCSEVMAMTPEGSAGMTYFVFDVTPGTYVAQDSDLAQAFVVPPGQQVYIGDFVGTPEGQLMISPTDHLNRSMGFSRDLGAAKSGLGNDRLEMAVALSYDQPLTVSLCGP